MYLMSVNVGEAQPLRFYKLNNTFFRDIMWLESDEELQEAFDRKITTHTSLEDCKKELLGVAIKQDKRLGEYYKEAS